MKAKNSIVELKKTGRKPRVSLEQIIEGAELLKSQRREITGWTLRDAIGAGGPDYLVSEWERYQAESGITSNENEEKIEDYILPVELEDKIKILIADVSLQINTFAAESDALANNVAEKKARSAYDTMMQNNKKLVEGQDLANRLLLDADLENENQQEQILLFKADIKSDKESIGNLQSSLDKTTDEYTRVKFILAQAQSDLIDEKKKRSDLEKSEIKLNTKLEDAVSDKKNALNQLEVLKTELVTAQANYTAREEVIKEKDKRLITLESQLSKLEVQLYSENQ